MPKNESGRQGYGPYREVADLVDATVAAMQREARERPVIWQFHDELRLVNEVHTERELKQLKSLHLNEHRRAVRTVMDAYDPSAVRRLVRDIASINVVITDDPEALEFNRRQWPEVMSVPPTSLLKLFTAAPPADRWITKAAREKDVFQGGTIQVEWEAVTTYGELLTAGWLIAVHPDYAIYDSSLGLVVGRGGPARSIEYRDRRPQERYTYAKEAYAEHIRRVPTAGSKRDGDYAVITQRLAASLQVDSEILRRWLDLIYTLHDVGKLAVEWQDAIWKWQEQKSGPCANHPPLAHSDFDPTVDWRLKAVSRPPHAAEGAYACAMIFQAAFDSTRDESLWKAALTAVTRHHGTFSSSLANFRLTPQAAEYVLVTLADVPREGELIDDPCPTYCKEFGRYLVEASTTEQTGAFLLYLYLVRRLRLADQNSFQEN